MNILFANISKFHQLIGYILEVGSGAVLGGIDPLDHLLFFTLALLNELHLFNNKIGIVISFRF